MDVAKTYILKMKNINWGEIVSFLIPVAWSSLFGAVISALMKMLKVFKTKDEKFSRGFFFQLLFESTACVLFGILFGGLVHNLTDDMVTLMAFSAFGGAFGEKLYNRLSKKVDGMDSVSDLDPTGIMSEIEQEDNDSTNTEKKKAKW